MPDSEDPKPKTPQIDLPANALVIVPVRGMVLFPGLVLPLTIGRTKSIAAAQEAARQGLPLGLLPAAPRRRRGPGPGRVPPRSAPPPRCCAIRAPRPTASITWFKLSARGENQVPRDPVPRRLSVPGGFEVETIAEEDVRTPVEIEARAANLRGQASRRRIELLPQAPPAESGGRRPPGAGRRGRSPDLVASIMDIGIEEKQEVLGARPGRAAAAARAPELMNYRKLEVLRLTRQIQRADQGEGRQPPAAEYLLREQLKTIQKELGEGWEGEGRGEEIAELKKRICADAKMPEEVETPGYMREVDAKTRAVMPDGAAEIFDDAQLSRLAGRAGPWSVRTEGVIDLAQARKTLDEDHFGLEKVTRRILEYLAVQ